MCEKAYDYFFNQGIQPTDMVFLVTENSTGWKLVNKFESKGIQVNHVFEDKEKSHRHKRSFWLGDSRLKIATVHSFKGWELKTVILLIPNQINENRARNFDYLIYTGISRTLKDICVINCCRRYDAFGQEWQRLTKSNTPVTTQKNSMDILFPKISIH
ncbi:MAG: hypothetical protein ABRQ39_32770 [Candidatus Eremiobacterota bacterium]